jgi:hypothetical protein
VNIPLPRRDWSDWLDRPAWWYLDGLVVYGHLERIDETTRGQRLALVIWDQPEAGRAGGGGV